MRGHLAIAVEAGNLAAEIDIEIAPILKCLRALGLVTRASCQDHLHGRWSEEPETPRIQIFFENVEYSVSSSIC